MTFRYIILFSIVAFGSCHFLGPRDKSNDISIEGLAELKMLPGNWKATKATYNLLKKKKYHIDGVTLVLYRDSTFTVKNLPDCINSAGDSARGKLVNAKGRWIVYQFNDKWKLQLRFDKNERLGGKTFLDLDIALVGSTFKVWQYIGDPDQADVIEFGKRR